jgi:hypothetical protein
VDDRSEEAGEFGDLVGVELGGAAHPGGVAEQFPDRDGVVGHSDAREVIVGGVVEVDRVLGGEPEHRGDGDQGGDTGGGEPVGGVQGLAVV